MRKVSFILAVLLLLCIISTCVYFVVGVSSTFPPIKTYDYKRNVNQFKRDLSRLANSNRNISYTITDTTGSLDIGYRYYFDIFINEKEEKFQYHVFYDKTDYWFKDNITQISLVYAYNETRQLGGYGMKATGIGNVIRVFENKIINKLPK